MNLQRPTLMFSLILLAVSIVSGFAFQEVAYAQEQGMSLTASAENGATTISISGHTSKPNNDVTIVVKAPNGNVVSVDQISPNINGDYMTKIMTTGLLFTQDGKYTITAQQGPSSLHKLSVNVEVVGGSTLATLVSQSTLEKMVVGSSTTPIRGLTIMADAIPGATTIGISGNTDRTSVDVTIVVKAPNGNIVTVDQISPNINGEFMADIHISSQLMKQNGFYTITASQGDNPTYRDSVEVEIVDGAVIPEFGTIAALILAVAIISIIAVTAKTRLRVMPKY